MVDRHNENLSFWSPQAQFIGAFFGPQQLVQLAWLWRLYKLDPRKPVERAELDQIGRKGQNTECRDEVLTSVVDFVPFYALGNVCIGSTSSLPVLST